MNKLDTILGVALVTVTGCQDVIDLDPLDSRTPVEARVRPKPIIGGTLAVMADGVAVAADPDRDLVHIADTKSRKLLHTVALQAGDEPGRVVEGSDGLVHVVLRRFGGIATIDRITGTVLARNSYCSEPRGLAFDASDSTLHLACADGALIAINETSGARISTTMYEPDLRDVVVLDGERYVSRLRDAAVVHEDGQRFEVDDHSAESRVAWRTWVDNGRIAMLHQLATVAPVPIDIGEDTLVSGGSLPYGGGGDSCAPGIVNAALTIIEGDDITTRRILDAPLTVDAALSPNGDWLAMAMPGAEEGTSTIGFVAADPSFGFNCAVVRGERTEEQITAVAFAGDALVMQSREPARLLVQDSVPFGMLHAIELEGDSTYDTGHEIFHRATESGLSCATCHPEGTDDGHVWLFNEIGKRRTQPLDINLAESAPFHWDGEMGDVEVLVGEVLAHRMGGKRQSHARGQSFSRWLFEQERPPARAGNDDAALVAEGEALFAARACNTCHDGDNLAGNKSKEIRGIALQVPNLRRVSLRPPFMHDGRSETLDDAVQDMIETTTTADSTPEDVAALSAYLRTL